MLEARTDAVAYVGGVSQPWGATTVPTFAVVLKAYAWDDFVKRQAERCSARVSHGDFYVCLDETSGALGPVGYKRVIRTSNQQLVAMGFADRTERRTLLWWNPDYAHYHMLETAPAYDYYVFVEYDACLEGSFDTLVLQFARAEADFAALPLRESIDDWCWTAPHLKVYSREEIEACLICVSVFSRRALELLASRRRAMSANAGLLYWPSAEIFLPTEIKRAGYRFISLSEFAQMEHFRWRPPVLETDVVQGARPALYHPVYDRARYVHWALTQAESLWDYVDPGGRVLPLLYRFPARTYVWPLARALCVGAAGWFRRKARMAGDSRPSST